MKKGMLHVALITLTILQFSSASAQWFWQNQAPLNVNRTEIQFVNSTTAYSIGTSLMKTTDFGITWSELNLPVNVSSFSGMQFLSPEIGYVTVSDGRILKTRNGGITWTILSTGTNYRLYTVHFVNEQIGYAGGNRMDAAQNGIIMKTENGGETWEAQGPLTNYITLSFSFPTMNTGYAGTATSWILKTTDGGLKWTRLDLDKFDSFEEISFTSANTGFAVGYFSNKEYSLLLKTTDGGISWVDHIPDHKIPLRKIKFTDASKGWAMCNNGIILKTTDSGDNWSTINLNTDISTNSFSFGNGDSGIVVGNAGLLLKTTNMGVNWTQPDVITQSDLNKIVFTSTLTGYAAGKSGTILKTPNGGLQWQRIQTPFTSDLSVLSFIDNNTGFTGQMSGLYKTTNGGDNWQFKTINTAGMIIEMKFTDNANGTLIDEAGNVFKSTNTGETWTRISVIPLWFNVSHVSFADLTTIYAAVDDIIENKIYKSVDSGLDWTLITDFGPADGLNIFELGPMKFTDRDSGYLEVSTNNFQNLVLKTTNGGLNWAGGQATFFSDINDIVITPNNNIYIAGAGGHIFKSTDRGSSWYTQVSGTHYSLSSMYFVSDNLGYAAGESGTIINTVNGGEIIVGINNSVSGIPNEYSLYQNYPNPFNPSTKIKFEIPTAGNIKIQIFDIAGRFISSITNNYYQPGSHVVTFDASGLSSGIYFYRLISHDYTSVRKMVLVR